MGTLYELAQEYRQSQKAIEYKIALLERELNKDCKHKYDTQIRIKKLIKNLKIISAEMAVTISQLEHYYDR